MWLLEEYCSNITSQFEEKKICGDKNCHPPNSQFWWYFNTFFVQDGGSLPSIFKDQSVLKFS